MFVIVVAIAGLVSAVGLRRNDRLLIWRRLGMLYIGMEQYAGFNSLSIYKDAYW